MWTSLLATQRDPQNDWTATQNRVNYMTYSHRPHSSQSLFNIVALKLAISSHVHFALPKYSHFSFLLSCSSNGSTSDKTRRMNDCNVLLTIEKGVKLIPNTIGNKKIKKRLCARLLEVVNATLEILQFKTHKSVKRHTLRSKDCRFVFCDLHIFSGNVLFITSSCLSPQATSHT